MDRKQVCRSNQTDVHASMTRLLFPFTAAFSACAIASPALGDDLTWDCFGSMNGKPVQYAINEARGPGADVVTFWDQANQTGLILTATGPTTEEAITVGRGQEGIRQRRVYKDPQKRCWIYGNWDAHPSFKLYEESDTRLNCTPVLPQPGGA